MIERYLESREVLAGVVQVVDIRHPPTEDDQMMWEWLQAHGIPSLVVATKADKISRGQWLRHQRQVEKGLGVEGCVLFSSETGVGRDEVWKWIADRMTAFAKGVRSPS
jgi:GTP-binding protein